MPVHFFKDAACVGLVLKQVYLQCRLCIIHFHATYQATMYNLTSPHTPPPCMHAHTTHTHMHSRVPAFLNVVDIAGLVKGAHEGQGLGNAFLANISACDALFHILSELRLLPAAVYSITILGHLYCMFKGHSIAWHSETHQH